MYRTRAQKITGAITTSTSARATSYLAANAEAEFRHLPGKKFYYQKDGHHGRLFCARLLLFHKLLFRLYSQPNPAFLLINHLYGKRRIAVESELQLKSRKRGGAKMEPLHLGLMIASTLLLTLAGIFLIMHLNILGIVAMLLGIALRVVDTRL
jgi:hypothetical protein